MRFVLRLERDFGLLYDRETHGYVRVEPSATALLASTAELGAATALAALTARVGHVEADAQRALARHRGWLDANDHFPGTVVPLPPCDGTYAAPLAAHLGLTTACNFACRHCYSRSGRRSPGELTRAEIERVLDELAAIGCQQLVFGGGEPFVRQDLGPLVARAAALGLDTYVHTNGALVDEAWLETLLLWPPSGLTVSLDGATAETNDRVRGPGTFARILASFARIRAHYPPGFAISMTLTGTNHHETEAVVELAHREGAKLLLLRPPFPAGNLLDDRALMVDLGTFWRAVGRARVRAEALGLPLNCPEDGGAVLPTDFEGFGCIAGHVVLGITPTGEITPCLNLPSEYVAGNVRERSVLEVWREGASFQRLRGLEPDEPCKSCEHYATCRGGCRIRAIDAGHGERGPDTWCYKREGRGVAPFGERVVGAPPEPALPPSQASPSLRLRVLE